MKNLFIISESEKQRILGMHKKATQKHYLSEAILNFLFLNLLRLALRHHLQVVEKQMR